MLLGILALLAFATWIFADIVIYGDDVTTPYFTRRPSQNADAS